MIFKKAVLRRGIGLTIPVNGSLCQVLIETELCQGASDVFVDLKVNEVTTMTLGEWTHDSDGVVHTCVRDMVQDEVCELQLDLHMEATSTYRLTLCSFSKGKELWEMSESERLTAACCAKTKGNELHKSRNVSGAVRKFSQAARYLISMGREKDISPSNRESWKTLSAQVFLNLAACQLQAGYHDAVVKNCSRALELDKDNIKGFYRRAQSWCALGKIDEAKSDLLRAEQLEPSNSAVSKLLGDVQTKIANRDSNMASAMRKMFSS